MTEVHIVGVGMTPTGRHLEASVKALTAQAVRAALEDAGCAPGMIGAAWVCNTRQGVMEGQHGIRGQCALRAMGFEGLPIVNCDNACASSSTGLNQAVAAIRAGACDLALVVGAEKMVFPERRARMFEAFLGGMDRDLAEVHLAELLAAADDPAHPPPPPPPGERSIFMDSYAAMARHHMRRFGTTRRQLAVIAAKNRQHAVLNPHAQLRTALTPDEVLAEREIVWPLTRAMCTPISDGAAAIVLCAAGALRRLPAPRPVRVRASAIATGVRRGPDELERHVGRLAALRAFEAAGVDPADLSLTEVHDATAFAEIRHCENLGLCPIGEGGRLAEAGHTRLGGRVPVNPSGGLIATGHPIAATGAIQIHELVTQLRHEAGLRQVAGARLAAALNGGGFYAGEEAVAVATVLEKV